MLIEIQFFHNSYLIQTNNIVYIMLTTHMYLDDIEGQNKIKKHVKKLKM